MTTPTLEFWIGYGSTYSYLSVMRIEGAAKGNGVQIAWRPFNIRALMVEKGLPMGPFIPRPDKLTYMWRDLERRAQRRGLAYMKPQQYPVDSQQTVKVAYLAAEQGWCSEFSRKVFAMNFVEARPIGGPGQLAAALTELGRNAEEVISRAHQPDIEEGLALQTHHAIELGIFGSPSFIARGDLFWGDDRLEDAIEWALHGRLAAAP